MYSVYRSLMWALPLNGRSTSVDSLRIWTITQRYLHQVVLAVCGLFVTGVIIVVTPSWADDNARAMQIRPNFGGADMCLDVEGGSLADRAAVKTMDCAAFSSSQLWFHLADGRLKNAKSGKCIDVDISKGWEDEVELQQWGCAGASSAQVIQFEALPNSSNPLGPVGRLRGANGKCLDLPGRLFGIPVRVWGCAPVDTLDDVNRNNQLWVETTPIIH